MKHHLTFHQALTKIHGFVKSAEDENYIYYNSPLWGQARAVKIRGRIICVSVKDRAFEKHTEFVRFPKILRAQNVKAI